ncbi:MAG: molybdenum ABC transporter permease subunit [Betaproteobacteria bacterium CG2_30_59_46]|nr:MAG: molybdenum ABC transporter permease subunit [Betaproteobacteria bacterium CG2_30_59_46]PIQ13222.1 MAG: molybdate ABC transporter permease subunit [Hydrogenophilales bacterium CG18_big_fil_WC_8_21_14_2_50_58_12]PIY00720.1 MAG: molybdate ABC transporter permease subunit [Hydrogenophilales bacterium CG_4_10_14_3_um_filter_58_23]PJB06716.1 MAG: molybdate ABC transporter permease subunit [Hydrogenophilales bacterium CG_4_9_14_3_um_filter_59_35]
MSESDWLALKVTLELSGVTTLVLLVLGTPLAWWLARSRSRFAVVAESIVALPLVLPPTVLGFYMLVLLGPKGLVGSTLEAMGLHHLAFTFPGLVVASTLYSLPFMTQPLKDAFNAVGNRMIEAAATLRAGPWDRFFTVAVPMARRGFLTAITLTFAHTVGEFGVVLMVGGNIPDQTRVLSIAIYDHAEAMEYASAHILAGGLLAASFLMLVTVYALNRRYMTVHL